VKLNAAAIRSLLTPAMVLDHFDIKRRGQAQWAVQVCPKCGQLKRGSLSIHPQTGLWRCFACESQGGIFDLVAGYANIDPKQDFHRVLGIAATIAGVPHGVPDEDYAKLLEEHRAKRAAQSAAETARRDRIRARMPAMWSALDRRNVTGEAYLRDRGIDPAPLYTIDAVRYSKLGDPAVRLHDLATGNLTGIQYRMLHGDTKLLAQPGSQTAGACLLGRLATLEERRLAIIVEGLADTLVAHLLWPEAAIFGAAGAAQLETISAAVSPVVAQRRSVLLIVPHDDKPGFENTIKAGITATAAGLDLVDQVKQNDEAKVQIVDLGKNLADQRHNDLADAWKCSRWRWRWPEADA
jgi:hypothetical protein